MTKLAAGQRRNTLTPGATVPGNPVTTELTDQFIEGDSNNAVVSFPGTVTSIIAQAVGQFTKHTSQPLGFKRERPDMGMHLRMPCRLHSHYPW